MTEAFFEQIDEKRFRPTVWTRGPWGPESQHGGPPAALLGRAIERVDARADMIVARLVFDILRPVPIEPLEVTASVVRPGRNVQLVQAALRRDGEDVMTASAWRIRTEELDVPETGGHAAPAPPSEGVQVPAFATGYEGYLQAMDWLFVGGAFNLPGPATAWLRMNKPLLVGESPTPLTRVLIAADSASGISAALDFRKWLFVNPDLSIYLTRMPEGEWVCLDACTTLDPHGVGQAAARIYDRRSTLGHSLQSLFVARRRDQEEGSGRAS